MKKGILFIFSIISLMTISYAYANDLTENQNNSVNSFFNSNCCSISHSKVCEHSEHNAIVKHICSYCNGKGTVIKDFYPPLYGTPDTKVYCKECDRYFLKSTGHRHITCPSCHGLGYYTTNY